MAVIPRDEAETVLDALISSGYTATFMETKGGMLRQSQYTLFTAVNNSDLDKVCGIIKDNSVVEINDMEQEIDREELFNDNANVDRIGGAIIFVWNLHKVEIV